MVRIARGVAAAIVWALAIGCSSEDSKPSDADASVQDAPIDPCSAWTTSGDRCPVATKRACFPMCATGGCFCERRHAIRGAAEGGDDARLDLGVRFGAGRRVAAVLDPAAVMIGEALLAFGAREAFEDAEAALAKIGIDARDRRAHDRRDDLG